MTQNNLDQLVAKSVESVLASLMPTIVSNVVTAVSGQVEPETAEQIATELTGGEVTEKVTSINGVLVNKSNAIRAYNWLRRNLESGYSRKGKGNEQVINEFLDATEGRKVSVTMERADNSHVTISKSKARSPRNEVVNGDGRKVEAVTIAKLQQVANDKRYGSVVRTFRKDALVDGDKLPVTFENGNKKRVVFVKSVLSESGGVQAKTRQAVNKALYGAGFAIRQGEGKSKIRRAEFRLVRK